MSATATGATFDQGSIEEIMIRWKVAEEYLSYLDIELLPREHALRVLVSQDVPSLLNEVIPSAVRRGVMHLLDELSAELLFFRAYA
ncbi:MAG: hypothetical protein ACR2IV_21710 [Bryobacteraceae bacterium]